MKIVATEVKVFYPQLKVGIDKFPLYVFKVPFTGRTEFVFTELSEKDMGIISVGEDSSCETALPFLADIMGYLYSLEEQSYMSLTGDCGSIVYRNSKGYFILSYFGGFYRGKPKFVIPNEVVREQVYTYLLDNYHDNHLYTDKDRLSLLEENMAYDGEFKPFFQFIADCIYTFASQRDRQKGESFVHGYTLALTSLCCYYRPISELDNQNGYADIFLRPRCEIYKDMEHSYIIELKYLKSQATEAEVKAAVKQAEAQVCRYAETVNVNDNIGHTTLHKVYVVYRGVEMVACDEV